MAAHVVLVCDTHSIEAVNLTSLLVVTQQIFIVNACVGAVLIFDFS